MNRPSLAPPTRPPFWRNATFLKWAAQIGVLFGVVALGYVLIGEAAANMRAQGLSLDWDLLTDPPGIQLGEGIFVKPDTGLEAFYTGAVNMLRVAMSGILAATVIGAVVGIARLSSNWLASRLATAFVETVRNIPVLVQVVFWFFLSSILFPVLEEGSSGPIPGLLLFSRKGISFAWPFPQETFWQWGVFLVVGLLTARWAYRTRMRRAEEMGEETRPLTRALLIFLAWAIVGWFAHPLAGAVGWLFGLLAAQVGAIPVLVYQVMLALAALYLAWRWIHRFMESRRSPAGLAKLTDDDYFRVILAGVLGTGGAAVLLLWPGITELGANVFQGLLEFCDQKFDFLRTGAPLAIGQPSVEVPGRFAQIADTGMTMTPSFFGIWMGVTLYTASFIAEIVRGGVLSVPKGQTEAGYALGLRRGQLLRMVILPQAFRVILPPLGNQYLNLSKNTSLGIAVAFPEMVQVGQTMFNQTGDTIQVILLWMGFYLTISLLISLLINFYNRRAQLVER
ncbi:MAG: ABC transporter permease subunit [Actinomycetia bacterium]|nr:ABC transporter permease subunit [Actinomycetes bacterium]